MHLSSSDKFRCKFGELKDLLILLYGKQEKRMYNGMDACAYNQGTVKWHGFIMYKKLDLELIVRVSS